MGIIVEKAQGTDTDLGYNGKLTGMVIITKWPSVVLKVSSAIWKLSKWHRSVATDMGIAVKG